MKLPKITYTDSTGAVTFLPLYPAINKPAYQVNANRNDVFSTSGVRQTTFLRVDTLYPISIPLIVDDGSDLQGWERFVAWAQQGGQFVYYPDRTDGDTSYACFMVDKNAAIKRQSPTCFTFDCTFQVDKGVTVVTEPVLDSVAAIAAYSTHRLFTAYTGPLLRARRASDGAEQDFTYDASNFIDVAALALFAGSSTLTVTTLYAQSNNGPATQTDPSKQPALATDGTITYNPGQYINVPWVDIIGGGDPMSILVAAKAPVAPAPVSSPDYPSWDVCTLFSMGSDDTVQGDSFGFAMARSDRSLKIQVMGGIYSATSGVFRSGVKDVVASDATLMNAYLNGTAVANPSSPPYDIDTVVGTIVLGAYLDGAACWQGSISSLIVWNYHVPADVLAAVASGGV